jgi:3-keto-5-aminohexanoate cleavage enzyme
MHTTHKLRIPLSAPRSTDGSVRGTFYVDLLTDMAAELLFHIDGDEGELKNVVRLEMPETTYPGDFIQASAEVSHWGPGMRRVAITVQKLAGSIAPAVSASGAGHVLTHAKLVCAAEGVFWVADERRRLQNAIPPLIITAAPVGYQTTREDSPHLPLTPEEIAADVARCAAEGATVVHLHVRDAAGRPTQRRDVFAETIRLIRARCSIIVQVSTEGEASMDVVTRCEPLGAGADMASLAPGTVNRGDHIFFNSKPVMEHMALLTQQAGLVPCIECCDLGFIENTKQLAKRGLVKFPGHFELVLGAKGGMGARREVLSLLVETIPRGSTWSVAGVGRHQLPMAELAVRWGGHTRVGLEDNVYLRGHEKAKGSAPLVARVAEMAQALGRPVADVATARRILGLPV